MIKKFIRKLLGRSEPDAVAPAAAVPDAAVPVLGVRREVPREQHGIDPKLVDERALKVVATLREAGHEAYLVGGGARPAGGLATEGL
jgi:poly(A) polymerase